MAAGSRSATSGTLAFQGVYRHTGGRVLTVGDYLNGIDCPSVGTCCAVGENGTEQGILATLTGGTKEKATVVPGTEYLYGIGCTPGGLCLLTGVGTAGAHSSGAGVVVGYSGDVLSAPHVLAGASGFGQVACGITAAGCVSAGAAFTG